MRSERNNNMPQMMPFMGMPTNMMMFPNYMNDNYSNLENRVNTLENKVRVLENRISRIENPYQNTSTQSYQNTVTNTQTQTAPYQTTQNNTGYNGEMYMM